MAETRIRALSLAERDRRWAAIRATMAARGLDCLIVRGTSSKWDSGTANVRYISQIGGNGEELMAVFPATGAPIVFIWAPSQLDWWGGAQDWVDDIRQGSPSWAEATVAGLKEIGCERGRIGVVGIGGVNEAGRCMSYDIYTAILGGLPDAHFEPASDIVESLRLIKSDEEVDQIAKATTLCDVGVRAMLDSARPGARAEEVYGEIVGAVLREGGESPMFLMYEADPAPRHAVRFPSDQTLAPGYMILQEISPKYAGYWSQIMVPVSLGEPDPIYRRLGEAACLAYDEALKTIRAGITTRQLAEAIARPVEDAGFLWYRPQWQGLGLEQTEGPMDQFFGGAAVEGDGIVLEANMVLGLQPMAGTRDRMKGVQVGDAVVVTETGVRKLGETEMRFHVL